MPHDVRDLRLETLDDGQYIVVCKCGWRSPPAERAADALGAWETDHLPAAAPTHGFVAIVSVGDDEMEAHCSCGWTTRGDYEGCLQELEAHVSNSI